MKTIVIPGVVRLNDAELESTETIKRRNRTNECNEERNCRPINCRDIGSVNNRVLKLF